MPNPQEQLKKLLEAPLQDADLQKDPLKTALQNVQGNILHGHRRNFAIHTFLKFQPGKQAEVKKWLRDHIVYKIISAQDQLTERQEKNHDTLFVSCMLSASGYDFLGQPALDLPFSKEFLGGMKQATERLREPSYTSWEDNYRQTIDAMILLAHCDEARLQDEQKILINDYIGSLTMRHWFESGNVLRRDGRSVEHFGYVDSHSQPLFFQRDLVEEEKRKGGFDQWDPGVGPHLVLTPDPLGGATDYGSYFVFRKLQQDVDGFERQIQTLATALGVNPDEAKALVVGRYPNGKPLVPHDSLVKYPNNFRYDQDVNGQLCPYHAHIRRMNPRWRAGGLKYDTRIARRGIPYGQQGSPGPVGLLFMCYQQSLETQFETLQGKWAHKPDKSMFSKTGYDPLIGAMMGVKAAPQKWPKPGGAAVEVLIGNFVTLQGGEYFFAPSINVLKELLKEAL